MSKHDIIPVYMIGIRRNDYQGVYSITHDFSEALDLFSYIAKGRSTDEEIDERFKDPWIVGEQLFIERYEDMEVGSYLSTNRSNVSIEKAEKLASEHGFSLEEINWRPY
jgi:hypothetical protein